MTPTTSEQRSISGNEEPALTERQRALRPRPARPAGGVGVAFRHRVARDSRIGPEAALAGIVALHRLGGRAAFELSGEGAGGEVRYWARRPADADIVRRQLAAAFPGSSFQEVGADLPLGDFVMAATLGLGRPDAIPLPALVGPAPIRVGTTIDPVAGILAVLDDVRAGERVLFQIVVEPGADGRWGQWAREFLNGVEQSRRERVPDGSSIWDLFSRPPDPMRKLAAERLAEAVKVKLGDLLFRATVRLLATGPSRERVLGLFRGAVAPLTSLAEAGLNELVPLQPGKSERVSDAVARRSLSHEVLLSAHDCISLWHPAHQGMGAGRGAITRGVDLPAPSALLEDGVQLGYESSRPDAEAVQLPLRDLRQHMVVLGATGTGKSTLVLSMLLDVIARGQGGGLIEGKGDLADELLGRIPEHRVKDVVVIDPLDPDNAVGIDLFAEARRIDLDVATDFVTSVFQLQYADSWGVVFPRLMRASIHALLEVPDTTLLDLPLFLRDRDFRAEILAQVKDPSVQGFFALEFERLPPSRQLQATGPILARVGAALESAFGRYLFGQSASVSLRQAMDAASTHSKGDRVLVGFRPEKVVLAGGPAANGQNVVVGTVETSAYFGADRHVRLSTPVGPILAIVPTWRSNVDLEQGRPVWVSWDGDASVTLRDDR